MILSRRLQHMADLINDDQRIVWDLCCDHGKLGKALAFRPSLESVYLVDQVPEIIELLKKKKLHPKITVICQDAAQIEIKNLPSETLVIAGVGAYTAMKIIKNLTDRFNPIQSQFIISIHRDRKVLNEFLEKENLTILKDTRVEDAGRSYEVLVVSKV